MARWDPHYDAPVYRASFRVARVKELDYEFGTAGEEMAVPEDEAFDYYEVPTYTELRAAERERARRAGAPGAGADI